VLSTGNAFRPSFAQKLLAINIEYVLILHCLFTLYLIYLLRYSNLLWKIILTIGIIVFFLFDCIIIFFSNFDLITI